MGSSGRVRGGSVSGTGSTSGNVNTNTNMNSNTNVNSNTSGQASPTSAPTDKDQCKDGGWSQFGFKNQGECVSSVTSGKDRR